MLKQKITLLLGEAVAKAQAQGKLPTVALPEIIIERPQNQEHGDYASSLPLKLARTAHLNPMNIAREIAGFFPATPEISKIEVAPPGFLNISLNRDWLMQQVDPVLAAGETFGNVDFGKGSRIQIEFVSVNPTGPLHVGHGRGAVLGSTLASVLSAAGFDVEREYYINDAGTQVGNFYKSLYARYMQALGVEAVMPEDGYAGAYMIDLAKEIIGEVGVRFKSLPEAEAIAGLGKIGLKKMIASISDDLALLKVCFDVWFSEKSLFDTGEYQEVISWLQQRGYLTQKENATWFVSTALGEDKDNVIVRTDGTPTYFATDIAYHYDKFLKRKFDKVIDIWGADHMGHVSRMRAVIGALGIDTESFKVIISQMVTLRRGGELVKISKRSGDIITLKELVEEVGVDACRFNFLSRTADSQMDFDMELAKKQSADNPVYYVQYAHARICSILKLAAERNITFADGDTAMLTTAPEQLLIKKMLQLPEIVETIAATYEPHHLTYYAQDLANVFHLFYKDCRVVSDDIKLTKARLKLVKAAQIVLSRTLCLMGMNAPEKM